MAQTGFDEFKEVLSDFRSMSGLALKGTVALPLLNLLIKIGPPPSLGVSLLTSAVMFLAVLWVFHFLHDGTRDRLNRKMKVAIAIACAAAIAAAILMDQYTLKPEKGKESLILGFAVRPELKSLLSAGYTDRQALNDAEFRPERIWESWSITTVHLAMVLCWLLAFFSVAEFVAMFVVLQRRGAVAPGGPPLNSSAS